MATNQLVSVIMPVYNAEKYVSAAIESILNQTYQNLELLICDDGSTDNSWKIINSYHDPRIKGFKNENNIGSLLTRNFLFEKVKGDFITFQDADDFSVLNRLEKQVLFLKGNPDCGLVGTWASYVNKKGNQLFIAQKPVQNKEITLAFKHSIPIVFASSMVRKEVLEEVGTLRPFFADKGNYDYDWMVRISERFPVANLPEVLYKVRILPESNSKRLISPEKLIGDKLVQFFAKERAEFGFDSLMKKDNEKIQGFIEMSLMPYKKDRSLFNRERAEAFFSFRAFKLAMVEALKAILRNPLKVKNFRTLFYIFRKSYRLVDF